MAVIPLDILIEAKRAVNFHVNQGTLLSPHEAWCLAGHVSRDQTLWSIARSVAEQFDVNSEDICDYLERQFPQYTDHPVHSVSWHDLVHKSRKGN